MTITSDKTPTPPLGGSVADRSLQVATALSAEVVVLRERLEIFERLAVERGLLGANEIDHYHASPDVAAVLKTKRVSFLERVFGGMRA